MEYFVYFCIMKRLLDDYIFDDRLRYEAHTLRYWTEDDIELRLSGIMGAAVLCALLAETDEGDERGISLDSETQRNAFFDRYEREVRRDNGGLFSTEVDTLSQAYIEFTGSDDILLRICRNDRLYDLAVGLVMDYMQRLVREQVYDHIYEAIPWQMPFAQWLYDAAFVEARRQRLLDVDWGEPEEVYSLAMEFTNDQSSITNKQPSLPPMFFFAGEKAEHLMNSYFDWLWTQVQAEADMMPDTKERLALLRPYVLEKETNCDFLQPQLRRLAPEHLNLFRKWMRQWTEFIRSKMDDDPQSTFPSPSRVHTFKQELFADNVLPCPPENNYVKVCEYIKERRRYDEAFDKYYDSHSRVALCKQLTAIFGWYVDPGFLGSRINYRKKYKK